MLKYISTCIVMLMVMGDSNCQSASDFDVLVKVVDRSNQNDTKIFERYKNHISTKNELDITFSLAFLFYKNFISSQDGATCSFHPSCSEYGMLCVKEFGVIKGGIKTMDRLTRCNSLSPHKYTIDTAKRKLYDPIH